MAIHIERPTEETLARLGVRSWPVWTKEPSTFDWRYDSEETCFFLEGDVTVTHAGGEASFGKGDLVVFPKGMDCVWRVKKAVRKHYRFA